MPAKEPTRDNSLLAKMKAIEAHAIERSKKRRAQESLPFPPEAKAEPKPPEPTAQLIEFPQWPEDRRATAQAVFRSALFPAMSFKGGRPFLKEERLCAVEGVEVFFTGERFDQSDLDVYLELLKIARQSPFGTRCHFSAYSLLKALGRATGKANYKWLHSVIIRLCGGIVDMTDHQVRYFGGLVNGGTKDENTRHY
ncbi:MAG TPA: plasmid replication initiator TrfA, partial [Candidatus Competibacter sp.]|nr:plasmid replication initiator TrfA [Candidatus Competibacter sp.]